ncbi:DUF6318 family protein [Nocardioides sp. LHD-245]|uniref:DUF6318 family protein n=1 Tax=Nocardioides sp. LHD-245 TaxID=3051387 RepID=UPI0027E1B077|nr:DUF6318 family protein [Nocardioides sp. LHD-245]
MRTHRTAGGPPALGLFAAALVLLLSAAACTDDDPDPRDPTSTWSPTGTMDTPSPTATPPAEPVLPEAAKQASEEGARAFITYYWDLINYAQVTGDVKALKAASATTCKGCQAGIRGIRRHYRSGGSIAGGVHRVDRTRLAEVTSKSDIYAFRSETRVSHDAQTIISNDGNKEARAPGADDWNLYVLWVGDTHWRLDVMELN